ncbi:hypothetical protein GCM10027037_07110 [Mucilaginibacter koreensis]
MRPRTFVAFVSFIILAAGTYCPLISPFRLLHWNVYQLNKPYGFVLLLVAAAGIITVVMGRTKSAKMIARLSLLLVILLYVAAVLKVNNTFSFIPFKGVAGYMTRQLKFSWGWFVLFSGALLSVLTTFDTKRTTIR